MLVRFGPVKYSEAQLKQKPKVPPTIFMGQWDAEKQTVSWTLRGLPGKQGNQAATQEDAPAPAFEMVVAPDGKISIQNSENLPTGQISTGGATARTGEAPQEPEKPEFLTGMHRFQKGSEISDPRIMRYLPVEATDIRLISDRNGHMAHYRISAEAFDTFLAEVWERYREERAAQPKSWVHYSKEEYHGSASKALRWDATSRGFAQRKSFSTNPSFGNRWRTRQDTKDRIRGVPPGRLTTSTVRQASPAMTPATGNSPSRTTH